MIVIAAMVHPEVICGTYMLFCMFDQRVCWRIGANKFLSTLMNKVFLLTSLTHYLSEGLTSDWFKKPVKIRALEVVIVWLLVLTGGQGPKILQFP